LKLKDKIESKASLFLRSTELFHRNYFVPSSSNYIHESREPSLRSNFVLVLLLLDTVTWFLILLQLQYAKSAH